MLKINITGDFPGGPVVKTALPLQGAQVRSLVGELGSHMPRSTAKKKMYKIEILKNSIPSLNWNVWKKYKM